MRRSLAVAAVVAAAALGALPATSAATHQCAEGFELVCFAGCPAPPRICPWP